MLRNFAVYLYFYCACGNGPPSEDAIVGPSACFYRCTGDPQKNCGGRELANVHKTGKKLPLFFGIKHPLEKGPGVSCTMSRKSICINPAEDCQAFNNEEISCDYGLFFK